MPKAICTSLARHLNELHPEHQGRYAEVITSDVAEPDALIRKFKTETYPMVAVSVGMLDTGFDCREVLHLVLCRRVRSPILYQQMRGRGTRTAPHIGKRKFVIYDFFRNHQYFNDSDEDVFTGSGGGRPPSESPAPPQPPGELVELGLDDEWLQAVTYVEVGPEGERVDKAQYVSDWQKAIRSRVADDPILRKVRDDERLAPDEEDELVRRLNRPERCFNEENLRRAYRDPGGRCAVVVPEGALFGSTRAHKDLRERLLRECELLAVVSLPAGVFKPYAGVKTSVIIFRRPATEPAEGRAATGRVWFHEIRNDGFDPDKIQGGGRPETPEKNDIPDLMAAWGEYKASGYRKPPGVEAGAVLDAGSDEPRCWWAPFDAVAENDYNLTASRYKPRVAEAVPDEDPAELIREVLAIEHEITAGLEKLLDEVE